MTNPLIELDPNKLSESLAAIVNIPSVSQNEQALCGYLEEWITKFRPDANTIRLNNNLIVDIVGDGEAPIIFAGHIDTVPAATLEGTPNSVATISGDRLFGLGTSDMKSGVAVMLALLADINKASRFIFYEAEEISDRFNGLRHLAENHSDLLQGSSAILLEPTDGKIELGCQGTITVQAIFHGKRAHSARPWMGENAIHKATKTLEKLTKEAESQPKVEVESLTFSPALQVTVVSGGTSANVIPDNCVLTINHRFAPNITADQATEYLQKICGDADEFVVTNISEGAMPYASHPLAIYAKGQGIEIVSKLGWTDVARFTALGIPAINCGPGDPTLAHRADEHIEISKLDETYRLLKDFVSSIEI